MVVIHGLFGQARNWTAIGKGLSHSHHVVAVDVRNHGASPWSDAMSYPAMAADIAHLIRSQGWQQAAVIGHSLGGKVAMTLALTAPDLVARLVVVDIAPLPHQGHGFLGFAESLRDLPLASITRRSEADALLQEAVPDLGVRGFLLTNVEVSRDGARLKPNVDALIRGMDAIAGWPDALPHASYEGPTLVIAGGASDYVTAAAHPAFDRLFPAWTLDTVPGAGHWVHAENPSAVLQSLQSFLR